MPLPPLTGDGELPPGVHAGSLREVLDRFGRGSDQRQALAERLARIHRVAVGTGHVTRFVIFGSFVTFVREPRDVDVFLIMGDAFDVSRLRGETQLLFDHGVAQAYFGASVFWLRRVAAWPNEQAAVEFWQIKRDGGRRGIVEVTQGETS
jgi:hypothetical protein